MPDESFSNKMKEYCVIKKCNYDNKSANIALLLT